MNYSLSSNIGPFPIYGLLLTVGFLLSVLFAFIEWRKKGFSGFKFWLMIGWVSFFSLFGANWWYLIFNPSDWEGWSSLLKISTGRSILGAIFFGTISAYFFIKIWIPEIEWRRAFSILLPPIFIGQAIGRWGNFFNQEVYGLAIDDISWLPQWLADQMYIDGVYRQPLFLYESILNLFIFVLITFWMKQMKWFKPGTHGAIYLFSYGTIRASMELFRDKKFIMNWNGFPTSFLMAILFAIVGLVLFIYYQWIFNDRIAIFWEFKFPLKLEKWKKNFIQIFNRSEIKNKDAFKRNNIIYSEKVKKIDKFYLKEFLSKIHKEY